MSAVSETYNMDCMEYMRQFPDKHFNLCVTDPPYGVDLKYNTYQDTLDNWRSLMCEFIPEAKRICEMVIMPSCSIDKLLWIYENYPPDWLICWHKGSPGHASAVGFNDWEPLLVYGRIKGSFMHDHFTMTNTETMGKYGHPCPKPVKWYKHFYHKLLSPGMTVLEPFLGSGSARIAAYDMGFDFYATELDKEYFDAQEKRFQQFTSQLKMFV